MNPKAPTRTEADRNQIIERPKSFPTPADFAAPAMPETRVAKISGAMIILIRFRNMWVTVSKTATRDSRAASASSQWHTSPLMIPNRSAARIHIVDLFFIDQSLGRSR